MITLKLAAIAATSTCAVAAAGGVTYAMVGNSSPVPSAHSSADAAGLARNAAAAPGVPSAPVPTCLPKVPAGGKLPTGKLPSGKLPSGKLPTDKVGNPAGKLPTGKLPTGKLPTGKLPTGKVANPTGKLPTDKVANPTGKLPTDKVANPAGKLPTGKLPTCVGDVAPAKPALPATPALPAAPGLPTNGLTNADCTKLPPAMNVGASKGKDIKLPNGMHLTVTHVHSFMVDGQMACANVQKFAGLAGGSLTVERLKTSPQVTAQQLVSALKLPAGNIASSNGGEMWRSPAGDGMLAYSDKGAAVYVTGSPVYTPMLPGIMSQLQVQ